MSFQFPANPADGDIVVRGNLLATYDKDNNTWTVGEIPTYPGVPGPVGPQGPQGVQGNPGSGVNVTEIVDTFEDLPLDPETGSFIIVDDTNTLYYWDGQKYYDLGSPIRGPKGDQGETGDTGEPGLNGIDGRGWYGTAIDDSNGEYKIVFQSNDGLEFVTDDLKGGSWEPVYATADTPGLVKLGRGLDLTDEGELEQRDTYVQIETVPLGESPRLDDKFTLGLTPQFAEWRDNHSGSANGSRGSDSAWKVSATTTMQMGPQADMAIVYYFSVAAGTTYAESGSVVPSWFNGQTNLEVSGAVYEEGGRLTVPHAINISTISNPDQANRSGSTAATKIGLIRFEPGATVTFTASSKCDSARKMRWTLGRGRLVVQPFKTGAQDQASLIGKSMADFAREFAQTFESNEAFDELPVITPEDNAIFEAGSLKKSISDLKQLIDELTVQEFPPSDVSNYSLLMSIRQNLVDMKDMPGTSDQLEDLFQDYQAQVNALAYYKFRWE